MAEPKEIGTVWTLGCDVFIEDALTAEVQEIKVNDIVLSANIFTEGLSVEVGSDRVNAMDLDVRISMDGLKTYIIDSQIVPYEEVLKITDFSPEATNEKRYASSANTSKKIIDSVGELKGRVNVAEGDIDALEKRVDDLELKGTGGSGDGFWYLGEDGKIHSDQGIVVHGDAIVEGDTSSGGSGEDVVVGIQGVRVNGTTHYDDDGDGIVDLGTIEGGGGGGLTSVSWGDIQGTPPSVSTFDNDVPYVDEGTFNSFSEDVNSAISEVSEDIEGLSSLLLSMWHFDENGNGNLVTDKQVVIKNNLIIEGDTSSGGEGESVLVGVQGISVNGGSIVYPNSEGIVELTIQSGGGVSEEEVLNILQSNGYITSSALSSYYTKSQSDARYLALSGGTLYNGVSDTPLYIKSNIGAAYIGFKNSSDGFLGYYGFNDTTPTVYIGTSNEYNIIHSGNIGSQSVAGIRIGEQINTQEALDALNDGQNLRFVGVGSVLPSPIVASDGIVISIPWYNTTFGAQIAIDDQSNVMLLRTRNQGVWRPWSKIVSTADDGYVYGLGGMIDIQYADEINRYGGNLYIQHRGNASGVGTGGNTTGNVIMCANGGNVGIGTTSPNRKFHVLSPDFTCMAVQRNQPSGYGAVIEFYNTANKLGQIGWDNEYAFRIADTSGKSLISGKYDSLNIGDYFVISNTETNPLIRIAHGGYNWYIQGYQSNYLYLGAGSAKSLRIKYDGEVYCPQNLIVSGDTSSGSDIRFKDIIKNKTIKIEHIAKAPLFTFKWNDRDDDSVHIGSSAQYWEKVCPWLVTGEDFKSLNYATLGVAMGISLAKKAVNHEERIKVLEKEIKRLKEEMIHG